MTPDRSDIVCVYLPITAYGAIVKDAEVYVRPTMDQACPGNVAGIIADVWIEDRDLKASRCSAADATAILARIKAEWPDSWEEIKERAEANHLEGCEAAA